MLARWLHRYESALCTCVRTTGVQGTNNPAERARRPHVIARKISAGSRSSAGSRIRCALASVFYTFAARGLNPLASCLAALQTPLPHV